MIKNFGFNLRYISWCRKGGVCDGVWSFNDNCCVFFNVFVGEFVG